MKKLVFSTIFAFVLSFAMYSQVSATATDSSQGTVSKQAVNGWKSSHGTWYYYTNGKSYKGWLFDQGRWYYLDTKGAMKTGWYKEKGDWYYFDNKGGMATGWLYFTATDKFYYTNKDGKMQTGWVKMGIDWLYFQSDGSLHKGWIKDNGTWYYTGKNGIVTGWVKDNGTWYYLNSAGAMQTGWVKDDGEWYLLDKNGAMQTGWQNSNGTWYYLNTDGAMLTGWVEIDGKSYFLDWNGAMKTGWLQLGGDWYYLYPNGVMAVDTIIEGYVIDEDGVWIKDPNNTPQAIFERKLNEIAAPYGVTAHYHSKTKQFDLYKDGLIIGVVGMTGSIDDPGYVSGPATDKELLIKLAIAVGAPASEAELSELVQKADQVDMLKKGSFIIYNNEYGITIMWGFS
ncbi:hypothetical protein [Bacillus salipaludis]|uniref:N-acetylmuramoyl-L-alanine amidase family protein n=1 Tax=Bacillus salipaludis TaxID=2547811 RepID=A0ABW8RJZ9_9BACI